MTGSPASIESPLRRAGLFVADSLLRGYAQILFNRSHAVGVLLLLCTAVSPKLMLAGVLGVLLATATARLLHLSEDLIRSGLFGYNALLVALGGCSLYEVSARSVILIAIAIVATVFVTAAFHSALGAAFNLPALTLPFIFVFTLLLAAAPTLGVVATAATGDPSVWAVLLPPPVTLFLQSLGAIFFLPRVEAGALVLLALLSYSRIAVLLAVLGFAISQVLWLDPLLELSGSMLPLVLGYNFILTALALGGVWFVPSLSSFVLAAVGTLVCGLVTLGLLPFLTWNGIPPLILPFNLTILLLLYALRQRVQDRLPKSVDFLLGTPEENLNYYRTRISRFGANYYARFAAPYLGRWVCTQGVDGDETHRGPWRHAFDFEVAGPDGNRFRGTGRSLRDYLCYRLPVLACAAGTVARIADGVQDNPVGETNLKENWGNLVVLYHGPGVYSMVCHLSPGTLKVQEGQSVRQGDVLGLCGSSGRSPVPHLHFQLQGTARVGAPTLYAELHDVVREGDRPELHSTLVAQKGDVVRNLDPQEDILRLLQFTYGEDLTFEVGRGDGGGREVVTPDIDLFGNLLLRSRTRSCSLYYNSTDRLFTVYDTLGRRRSVLHLLHAALSRVPLEVGAELTWRDALPLRHFLPLPVRLLLDLVSPFVNISGVEMTYRARRDGPRLRVTGESLRRLSTGKPMVSTEAILCTGLGIEEIALTVRGKTTRARRVTERASDEVGAKDAA